MSEPEPRCRRAGAGLATGFAWNGSLPVEPVGVVLGRWPDVGTGIAWPSCRAGHRIARISQVVKMPQEAQQKRFGGVRRI